MIKENKELEKDFSDFLESIVICDKHGIPEELILESEEDWGEDGEYEDEE